MLIPTCTMTMVCISSEYQSYLLCTWLHYKLLFVSMLGNLHVNQWIYRHIQSDLQSELEVLFLFTEVQRSVPMMRIQFEGIESYEMFQPASLTIF